MSLDYRRDGVEATASASQSVDLCLILLSSRTKDLQKSIYIILYDAQRKMEKVEKNLASSPVPLCKVTMPCLPVISQYYD